jgi:hypothetical protein
VLDHPKPTSESVRRLPTWRRPWYFAEKSYRERFGVCVVWMKCGTCGGTGYQTVLEVEPDDARNLTTWTCFQDGRLPCFACCDVNP